MHGVIGITCLGPHYQVSITRMLPTTTELTGLVDNIDKMFLYKDFLLRPPNASYLMACMGT